MGDSHGVPETIAEAVHLFKDRGCSRFVHLGDVCDSSHPETTDACVDVLLQHSVITLRGNNDYAVVVNHEGRNAGIVSQSSIVFLKNLPNTFSIDGALFAHSSPFLKELGLSALVRDMGAPEMRLFFQRHPQGILFRGHSHSPQLCWPARQELSSKPVEPGDNLDIQRYLPCVITCGALTRGLCMIWSPDDHSLGCFSF